jgi:hypothetical protein
MDCYVLKPSFSPRCLPLPPQCHSRYRENSVVTIFLALFLTFKDLNHSSRAHNNSRLIALAFLDLNDLPIIGQLSNVRPQQLQNLSPAHS